jgi:hypothetical protein
LAAQIHFSQDPDEHCPERPILLAVDRNSAKVRLCGQLQNSPLLAR